VRNLAKTSIVQQAWTERELHLHGWVYGLHNGLVKDLAIIHDNNQDIDAIYRFDLGPKKT
jgi:carbonic anhydrase